MIKSRFLIYSILSFSTQISLATPSETSSIVEGSYIKTNNPSAIQIQIPTKYNSSNKFSLGNPFEQFQITQGLITTSAVTGVFPQPRAFVNSQLMWNTRSIPVCWTALDANRAAERGWVQNAQ